MCRGIATLFVTAGALATFVLQPQAQGGKNRTEEATFTTLPTFRGSVANGVSDVRADGARLVVGTSSQGNALVWVVRNP